MSLRPEMHCHSELLVDLGYSGALPDSILLKWFNDSYSTSKHLLTIYSAARGTNANKILEIGFGRSSFVLAKAALETGGSFYTCDNRDFSYLFNPEEKSVSRFFICDTSELWSKLKSEKFNVIFLDHFSSEDITEDFVVKELERALDLLDPQGVLFVHDTYVKKYKVGAIINKKSRNIFSRNYFYSFLPYNYGLGLIAKKNVCSVVVDHHIKKRD